MATFSFYADLDKIIPQGLQDENLALDMVRAGQEVMKSAIESGANKHKRTGSMANSVKSTKPAINMNGAAVGRVLITGKDSNGILNSYKALWLEYGAKKQPATPFVRPAIKSSESTINGAMARIFDQKIKE